MTDSAPSALYSDPLALIARLQDISGRLTNDHDRALLEDLSGAIRGGASAVAWRSLGPPRAFDIEGLVDQLAGTDLARSRIDWIEILRGAFIFFPVLITWFGISLAVEAYRQLLTGQPDLASVPFLYLWETGFNGELGWTLGQLAAVDALTIFGLVL